MSAEITTASLNDMTRAMRDVQTYLRKSQPETLKMAADMFTRSAAARCKPGAKTRRVEKIEGRRNAWLIEIHTQRNGIEKVFSRTGRKDPRAKIARRGLLQRSWWWLQKQVLGRPTKSDIPGVPVAQAVDSKKGLTGDNQFIELTNKLRYIHKAAPGVADVAMATAARGIQHRINRVISKQAERLWK